MQKLEFVIRNLAPVNFAEKSGDSVLYETKKYIPGNALRGACAAAYIKAHAIQGDAHLDSGFAKLFLSGKVRFLPAYPCHSLELLEQGYRPMALPVSLMKSKRQREVKNYIDVAGNEKIESGYKKIPGFAMTKLTPTGAEFIKVDAKTSIEFHMSRNDSEERITGSSIKGNVFNYEYLEPRQYFAGSIIFDDDIAPEEIKELLQNDLYLGRSKTAQYGKCECQILPSGSAKVMPAVAVGFLYLKTPYIPETEWQNMAVPVQEIITALQDAGVEISCPQQKIFAASEVINGFVGVWKLKRASVNAVSAGSLFAVEIGQSEANLAKLQEALLQGLGSRTEEGFGQIEVWNALTSIEFAEAPKPSFAYSLDENVKSKARDIMEKRFFIELHKQSEADAKAIYNVSTKHILKRIESLMGSGLSKAAIQSQIENMEDTAQANLKNMNLKGCYIYDLLVGMADAPYCFNELLKKMNIENGQKLFKEIGFTMDAELEEKIYKEYWLWTMRFAAKKGGSSNGK